jgi:tellurite resistance protein
MARLSRPIVPAGFFGIVLGLAGLAGSWRLAAKVWNVTPAIGEALSLLAAAIWLVLMLFYVAKWIWFRSEALAEFNHPVLCCFVGVIPVTTALVGWAIRPYLYPLALALAIVGIVGQLVFGIYRTGALWKQRPSFIFRPLRVAL